MASGNITASRFTATNAARTLVPRMKAHGTSTMPRTPISSLRIAIAGFSPRHCGS
jgi:hypothetical protein